MLKQKLLRVLKNKRIVVTVGVVIFICAAAITIHSCGKRNIVDSTETIESTVTTEKMYTWSESQNQKNMKDYDWLDQTTYEKTKDKNLSSELFALPFAMSEYYVTNKRLTEVIGDKGIQGYMDTAVNYLKALYNNSFRDILSDQDGFKNTINDFWCNTNTAGTDTLHFSNTESTEENTQKLTDLSDSLMQWYVDNKVVMKCDVSTAPCMVFSDDYRYYVRAEIAVTMNGGKNAPKELKKLYGMELEEGKTSHYITEIEFIPNSGISAFNILMKAKS